MDTEKYRFLQEKYLKMTSATLEKLKGDIINYELNKSNLSQLRNTARKILALNKSFRKISPPEYFIKSHLLLVTSTYYYDLGARQIIVGLEKDGCVNYEAFAVYIRRAADFTIEATECLRNISSEISM
ncbi:MAG: hypothetical protein NZM04_06700 [Methylacidiphilales bacterium]|nr:hypothetical protein [Candidatus Methylacidiphilales bacterium]